jgi:predicted PurR-regulated permease PerM
MFTLINILIVFFIFLILYQIILASNIVEGLENQNQYQSYDTNNPNNALILAQQNAGNIEYLKERIDNVQGIYQQVQDLSGNVSTLQTQVDGLLQAQQDYANQLTGGTAPEITGTIDTEDNSNAQDTSNLIIE